MSYKAGASKNMSAFLSCTQEKKSNLISLSLCSNLVPFLLPSLAHNASFHPAWWHFPLQGTNTHMSSMRDTMWNITLTAISLPWTPSELPANSCEAICASLHQNLVHNFRKKGEGSFWHGSWGTQGGWQGTPGPN